jgi:hypothetical protein
VTPPEQQSTTDEPEVGHRVPLSEFEASWIDDEPSFEERFAERAFFHASTVDEQSRNWLLGP